MDRFDTDDSIITDAEPRGRQPAKKRKWREIEALRDKFRLQRELQSIDFNYRDGLDELPL